jgi:Peptidase family M23
MGHTYNPGSGFVQNSGFNATARMHPKLGIVRPHMGVDFKAPQDTPVPAAADGRIWYTGTASGYDSVVILQHDLPGGGHYYTLYAHVEADYPVLAVGTPVYAGQTITAVGESVAPSSGDHLHFEVITGAIPASANGGTSIGLSGTQGRVDPSSFSFDGDGVPRPELSGRKWIELVRDGRGVVMRNAFQIEAMRRLLGSCVIGMLSAVPALAQAKETALCASAASLDGDQVIDYVCGKKFAEDISKSTWTMKKVQASDGGGAYEALLATKGKSKLELRSNSKGEIRSTGGLLYSSEFPRALRCAFSSSRFKARVNLGAITVLDPKFDYLIMSVKIMGFDATATDVISSVSDFPYLAIEYWGDRASIIAISCQG